MGTEMGLKSTIAGRHVWDKCRRARYFVCLFRVDRNKPYCGASEYFGAQCSMLSAQCSVECSDAFQKVTLCLISRPC